MTSKETLHISREDILGGIYIWQLLVPGTVDQLSYLFFLILIQIHGFQHLNETQIRTEYL